MPAPAMAALKRLVCVYAPHGHVAAIAPAGQAEPVGVDRRDFQRCVHTCEDVLEIAVAEVSYVGPGEGFALAVTAARIRKEKQNSRLRAGPSRNRRVKANWTDVPSRVRHARRRP